MMKMTGLVMGVVTTAAALFVAGCATQGTGACCPAPAACPAPAPACPANSCKGSSSCKNMSHCKAASKKCNSCNVDDQGS